MKLPWILNLAINDIDRLFHLLDFSLNLSIVLVLQFYFLILMLIIFGSYQLLCRPCILSEAYIVLPMSKGLESSTRHPGRVTKTEDKKSILTYYIITLHIGFHCLLFISSTSSFKQRAVHRVNHLSSSLPVFKNNLEDNQAKRGGRMHVASKEEKLGFSGY